MIINIAGKKHITMRGTTPPSAVGRSQARTRVFGRYGKPMNKAFGLILMVMSATASGAVPIDHRAQDFYEAMSMFYEQKFRAGAKLKTWKETYLGYQNEAKLDERGDCYGKSEGDVILVLQVEKDGVVSKVYASKENEKAECFIKVYEGEKLAPPPIAPTYELMRML